MTVRFALALLAAGLAAPACNTSSNQSPGPLGPGTSTTPAPSPTPTPQPAPTPTPSAPPAPATLRSATFEGANGYMTSGSAAIVQTGTAYALELHGNFRTSRSGALDVRLCRDTRCLPGDLDLGPIQKFEGAQTYMLSDDGGAYRYVVIWCRGVSLPFGFGRLR